MITAEMIAPCGLDCSLCSHAHDEVNPCPGCNGPDEQKYDYCRTRCGIIRCAERRENGYRFCDECPDFPCEDVMEKENRYMSKYPRKESPLANLRMIREKGMDEFLKLERRQWTCAKCRGIICVHTGLCTGCGEKACD